MLACLSLGSAPKPNRLPPEPTPLLPAEPAWTRTFPAPPSADAAMDEARVYVALQNGGVRALDRETGTDVWTEPTDTRSPLLVVGPSLYVALPDEIRRLDAATGAMRWRYGVGRPLTARLSWHEGLLFAALDDGTLIALRDADGTIAWHRTLRAPTRYPVAAVSPTSVALTLDDSRVVALNVRTGDTLWERSLPGSLGAPAGARDRVFVGSTDKNFYALDARDGGEVWHWRTGGTVVGGAAAGDRVFFAALDNVMRAVNRGNGNQLWKVAIPTRPAGPPQAVPAPPAAGPQAFEDVIVVAGVAPRIDAYAAKTGAALGTFAASADLQGVPLIDRTPEPFKVAVVVVTRDGRVTALRPTKLLFPDPPLAPLLKLPGRELPRERLPVSPTLTR